MKKSQNNVNYRGIGEVKYTRNPRARNFSIRINQQGEVKVTVPRQVSWRRAEAFFISRQQWVQKKLEELNQRDCSGSLPSEGELLKVRNKNINIQLRKGDTGSEDAIWRILREEALNYLPGRVAELSEKHGYEISGLKIRKMKSRWGSCTSKKSINLNSWLMMIPETLSDYVILHELAHTKHPNHGSLFWEELDRTTGGLSGVYRKELSLHRIMCIARAE